MHKNIYGLRIRVTDDENFSLPYWYKIKKNRDNAASINRIIGGMRTYSFEEKKTLNEINEIEFED